MLVAVIEIPFFEQLARATPATGEVVREAMERLCGAPLEPLAKRHGRFLIRIPREPLRDLVSSVRRLDSIRKELDAADIRDHLCLLFEAGDGAVESAERDAELLLTRLELDAAEADDAHPWRSSILVHADVELPPAVSVSGEGRFHRVNPEVDEGKTGEAQKVVALPSTVCRPNVVNRIVDAAFTCLQEEGSRNPVLVIGPDGVGKARSVLDAAAIVMGRPARDSVVVVRTLFNRKSAIHPFLTSIDPAFLDSAPRHLRDWERRVWLGKEALVRSIVRGALSAGGGPERHASICPDRLSADFFPAYRLYLLAHCRMMEERGLPALVLFEDIHTFHPEALRFAASLVRDMLRLPSFLPILTCRQDHDACALFGADALAVHVHPVALDEIREIAGSMYPGVELRDKAARHIRSLCGGQLAPIPHYLRHLERTGKITRADSGFTWVRERAARLPPNPLAAAWEEIEALPVASRRLLYLCSLAGGILSAAEILELAEPLEAVGATRGGAAGEGRSSGGLELLEEASLIRAATAPVILHTRLRGRLESLLGGWAIKAREAFAAHLEASWRAGETRSLVLLFSVLRNDRRGAALEVLSDLITQKLDELNLKGCLYFLDPAKLHLDSTGGEDTRAFERLAAMGSLRAHLLLGAWQRAEEAMDSVTNLEIPERQPLLEGQRALEQARFHLVKGDAPAAAKAAKTSVIQFHEAADERSERRAEAELGAALLAEGRLDEAAEYFDFVLRSPVSDAFPRIRSAALSAVASYLQGNLTGSIRLVEEGTLLAANAGRREWQGFLMFFRARQRFDLGQFDDAVADLEHLLCFARVYGLERASTVATAWMARAMAYGKRIPQALGLLERMEPAGEASLFRAEALYLRGDVTAAQSLLAALDAERRRPAMHPGERISWENGFASVEERCVVLRKDRGILWRLLRGFRSYLTALVGKPEQAMRELYRIIREERVSDLDPFLPLYAYWYATTLPEEGGGVTDHKLTVLNRAMKHLQQRSSRIESGRDRWLLMTANHWNARLLEEARSRHLV